MAKEKKFCGGCTRFPGNKNDSSFSAAAKCLFKNKVVSATTEACKTGHRPVKV